MNPRDLIRNASCRFREAGIPDPETDAALLLAHLTGGHPLSLRLDTDSCLSPDTVSAYESLVLSRLKRRPLQYLLGYTFFFGNRFKVDERVLIPRPETELLCEWALYEIGFIREPLVLDLCCGSGCIGLSLKHARPDIRLVLSDLSCDALNVAADNAADLGLDVSLNHGDLLDGFPADSFHMILSNPPYIPSSECSALQEEVLHEPLLALDGGADGMDFYRRIIAGARSVLLPGGILMLETGIGEADTVAVMLQEHDYRSIEVREDLNGIKRMIMASKP